MSDDFTKEVSKSLKDSDLGGSKELSPGASGRRYEPECGVKKHNERIRKESNDLDKYGNLPFQFSKPKKDKAKKPAECTNCGTIKMVNKDTVGIICGTCKIYTSVKEVRRD